MFQQNATSDEVSVTYSYIINHPKFQWLKTTIVILFPQNSVHLLSPLVIFLLLGMLADAKTSPCTNGLQWPRWLIHTVHPRWPTWTPWPLFPCSLRDSYSPCVLFNGHSRRIARFQKLTQSSKKCKNSNYSAF